MASHHPDLLALTLHLTKRHSRRRCVSNAAYSRVQQGDVSKMYNNSTILVTGGTGSFGRKFIKMTLARHAPKKLIIYSRDEMKQWEMAQEFKNDPRLRFLLGDVRDKDRLHRACQGVDYLVHAAAIKIVPSAEYNPFECIKTNVLGAMNIVDCALDNKIKRVIALSTDKACNPINLYGATKLCSDKLFVSANAYAGASDTRFAVVRYGNVMGSRGSVIPFFRSVAQDGELTITDERMTRFMITLEQGVELVWLALQECQGGEIYVKKIPSMRVTDIAKTIAPNAKIKITGIRPGEKLHEQMISAEDARTTFEYPTHYIILPQIEVGTKRLGTMDYGKPLHGGFSYSSETNPEWMQKEELQAWINKEYGTTLSDQVPTLASVGTLQVPETVIVQLNESFSAAYTERDKLSQLVSLIRGEKDTDALMLVGELIAANTETSPELFLIKAVAEARLGWTQEAFRSILHLMQHRPKHVEGQHLMDKIVELLKAREVLDFS